MGLLYGGGFGGPDLEEVSMIASIETPLKDYDAKLITR